MNTSTPPAWSILEWGAAGLGLELPSGDLHVVRPFPDGALVALIDGLGHGPKAAQASRAAGAVLEADPQAPVGDLIRACHDALKKTRGAVMTLASFNARLSTLTWTGVGNVDGLLLRASPVHCQPHAAILLRGGVVGFQLPPLREETLTVSPGDTLVMATDGIRSGFAEDVSVGDAPAQTAEDILRRFGKTSDDALVVVARYRGAAS